MKTLIINNHSKYIAELSSIFSNVVILDKEKLNIDFDISEYDLIVLSGGSNVPTVLRHPEKYENEIELIKNTNIPIVGICLGSEIIIKAFGGELKELQKKHKGIIKLKIINQYLEKILETSKIEVAEAHHVGIQELPQNFTSYAESDHGIEIFKHNNKTIIGFQFHPEVSNNNGIIKWILGELAISHELK